MAMPLSDSASRDRPRITLSGEATKKIDLERGHDAPDQTRGEVEDQREHDHRRGQLNAQAERLRDRLHRQGGGVVDGYGAGERENRVRLDDGGDEQVMQVRGHHQSQAQHRQEGRHRRARPFHRRIGALGERQRGLHRNDFAGRRQRGHEQAQHRTDHQADQDLVDHRPAQSAQGARDRTDRVLDQRRQDERHQQGERQANAGGNRLVADARHGHDHGAHPREDEGGDIDLKGRGEGVQGPLASYMPAMRAAIWRMKPLISEPISGRKISSEMKIATIFGA